jgi:protein arginine kinase activator
LKQQCDKCGKPATIHSVEIVKGEKIEKHLCDECARQEGVAVKGHTSINDLLTTFVKMHSGTPERRTDVECDNCGMTYRQFQETSLLGCPQCYTAFESMLGLLLERAHEGGTHHIGKAPQRGGAGEQQQLRLARLRKQLDEAVTAEDYELAAHLRDQITQREGPVAS